MSSDAKECTRCHKVQPLSGFSKSGRAEDGHRWQCKACDKIGLDSYRETHSPDKAHKKVYDKARYSNPARKAQHAEQCRRRLLRPGVKEMDRERTRKWRLSNKDVINRRKRESVLKILYGLTPEMVSAMVDNQAGLCAACTSPMRPGKGTSIDHCHTTGKVRGLLCTACNVQLGVYEKALIRGDLAAYLAAQ